MAAIDDLSSLLANLPNASLISLQMKTDALNSARIPDAAQVWPDDVGYVPTYDIYFAALALLGFLMAQPVVRQSSSEGTSVAVDAPSWSALATYYRSMSPICAAQGGSVLQAVAIPQKSHVYRTDMTGRYDDNDNVDTDLS